MKSVAITGRRPNMLPWQDDESSEGAVNLKNRLKYRISELVENGYTTYYVGMAKGVDTYVANILLSFREMYNNIKIIAVIPYKGFADKWHLKDRQIYFDILGMCDEVKVMNETYTKTSIFLRNKYMVDNADIVLAVYDNIKNGGTYNTLLYAKSIGKPVICEEI